MSSVSSNNVICHSIIDLCHVMHNTQKENVRHQHCHVPLDSEMSYQHPGITYIEPDCLKKSVLYRLLKIIFHIFYRCRFQDIANKLIEFLSSNKMQCATKSSAASPLDTSPVVASTTKKTKLQPNDGWGTTWGNLDKQRYYSALLCSSICVRTLLYPITVAKTRVQHEGTRGYGNVGEAGSGKASYSTRGTLSILREVVKKEGILRLYRGYVLSSCVGTIAAPLFLTTMESTRDKVLSRAGGWIMPSVASGLAGVTASCVTQLLICPADNIVQRLMVGKKQHIDSAVKSATSSLSATGADATKTAATAPVSSLSQIREMYRIGGFRSFYKGLPLSILCYAPTSMIFWPVFSGTRSFALLTVDTMEQQSTTSSNNFSNNVTTSPQVSSSSSISSTAQQAELNSQFNGDGYNLTILKKTITPLSAAFAGAVAMGLTTPFDALKTKIQLTAADSHETTYNAARRLVRQEGFSGFLLGLRMRVSSGAVMYPIFITSYELVKWYSTIDDAGE